MTLAMAAPLRSDVVALYVDPRGPYPDLVEEWYDEKRDARTYNGPLPVVAHPPCGPWGAFAHLCQKQSAGLAVVALEQVRRWGGVLEHPRGSRFFRKYIMTAPAGMLDEHGGFVIEVDQLFWGHVAHKRTWIYAIGIDLIDASQAPFPNKVPTHDLMGSRGKNGTANRGNRLEASQELRRRTPVAFAEWLLDLASQARRP